MQGVGIVTQPARQRGIAQRPVEQFGQPHLGVVGVALKVAGGQREHGDPSVGEADAVRRVSPALVTQPFGRAGGVLDVAVAVPVAVLVDPAQRCQRVVPQAPDGLVVAGPAPVLGEQDQPELGGVSAAVVRSERFLAAAGQLAAANLVQDLARLLVGEVVARLTLEPGQGEQRALGQRGPGDQRLIRGDQGVPAEDGEEPGQPCTGQHDPLALDLQVEPQRRQVVTGLAYGALQRHVVAAQHRALLGPPAQRVVGAAVDDVGDVTPNRLDHPHAVRQRHVQVDLPFLALAQLQVPDQVVALDAVGWLRAAHPGLRGEATTLVGEAQLRPVVGMVTADLGGAVPDPRLDLEQVGEVDGDGQSQLHPDRLPPEGDQFHALVKAVADVAQAPQAQSVRRQPGQLRIGEHVLRRVVVDGLGAQQQQRAAVDGQVPATEQAGVQVDKPADAARRHVPLGVGVQEGGPAEHREGVGSQLRRDRPLIAVVRLVDGQTGEGAGRGCANGSHDTHRRKRGTERHHPLRVKAPVLQIGRAHV